MESNNWSIENLIPTVSDFLYRIDPMVNMEGVKERLAGEINPRKLSRYSTNHERGDWGVAGIILFSKKT